ncbi:MAG: STAS/SEC14 domain-containing protein [Chloroflexota bacterium]
MTTVQLRSEVNIELHELIGGVSQLETAEIEQILSEISLILAQRKAKSLPAQESALLRKIGESVPDDVQNRYDELQKKLLAEELEGDEHQELLGLIQIVEEADVDRLKCLIELSQLRNITLDQLMTQLGLEAPPAYA